MFDDEAFKSGSEFAINSHTQNDQRRPVVTATSDGGFFVTWMSDKQIASGLDIYGQRFNEHGGREGNEIFANVVSNSYQRDPFPASLTDGSIVVAFHSDAWDGSYIGIFRRRFVFSGLSMVTSSSLTPAMAQLLCEASALWSTGTS
jgi:hypothetical protein